MGSEVERKEYHSPERRAELTAKLIGVEERVLGTVAMGLTAARNSMTSLTSQPDPSPSRLLQTAKSIESLYGIAKGICGDPTDSKNVTNVQINNVSASPDLVAAVAQAYMSIEQGHLDRAEQLIEEAGSDAEILDAELLEP